MKKCLLALLALMVVAGPVLAEDEEKEELEVGKWYNTLSIGLNLTQSSYSENWRTGENGALAWTGIVNGSARRKFANDLMWANLLKLRYGQTHQQKRQDNGEQNWDRPEKSEDKIDFETILLLEKGWEVDPYASGRFESQFQDITDPGGRDLYLNPMTFKESAGVSKHFLDREEEFILTRLGLTARQNYRKEYVDLVSDETTGEVAHDAGVELQGDWRLKIADEKFAWLAKVSIYKPFAWSKASEFDDVSADSLVSVGVDASVKDYTTAVDISWQNEFSTQLTKWISFNLYLEFVYDKYDNSVVPIVENGNLTNGAAVSNAIRKKGQYKQTFAIGITYRFL